MLARTSESVAPWWLTLTAAVLLIPSCDAKLEGPRVTPGAGARAGHGAGGRGGSGAAGGRAGAVAGSAGAPDEAGAGGIAGGEGGAPGTHRGGSSGHAQAGNAAAGRGATGAAGGAAGHGGEGEPAGAGGSEEAGAGGQGAGADRLEATVRSGAATVTTAPRPASGALVVANEGERVYAVETRRDIEAGPFGLPWRSRYRVAAYDGDVEAWSYDAAPDDEISDVVVHPSGDVTIAVLRFAAERDAYDLLRFERDGTPLGTTTLVEPTTPPAGDYGLTGRPLFKRKSELADATDGSWVRLVPDGEGVVAAFLTHVDRPTTDPLSTRLALGLEAFIWDASAFEERWARVVEGPHSAEPAAWAYDELRWREQAIRPFLARDDTSGDLVVGRAWNNTRCEANVDVFAEFTLEDCVFGAVGTVENERLPLAVTRFTASGERVGTVVLTPDADAAEQVAFALAARGGRLFVAGSVVRTTEDGSKRTYPDPSGFVDYDGYVAVYRADGSLVREQDYNLGRGDVLASLRLGDAGAVAVGTAGWDRWQGGMSISRGGDPLVAWLAPDGSDAASRVLPLSDGSRHFNLHDLAVADGAVFAHGFSDAPLTHSADGGDAARTFGALRIVLKTP